MDFGSSSVTEYPAGLDDRFAAGQAPPIRTIHGQNTMIPFVPTDMAVDGNGEIYVSSGCDLHDLGYVVVFAALADGNAAPIRTLNLPSTICDLGMWVDPAGYLYVPARNNVDRSHEVAVFAPGASGNAAPIRLITGADTRLRCPVGASTDSGGDLYVADRCTKAVLEFSPSADGDAAPIAMIKGSKTLLQAPTDVKLGSDGRVYAADTGVIDVFAAGADGNVAPVAVVSPPTHEIFLQGIATAGTDLVAGVQVPGDQWAVDTYHVASTVVLLRSITGPGSAVYAPFYEAVH